MDPLRFVVNRHHATTLHFDLRLEVDGTLPSWAVPKGPSLDPAAKRLAVEVDDHGMEHLDFEDERKVVWDTGLYVPAEDPGPALDGGHLRFVLGGQRLRGAFALTRTRMGGNPRNWILVKIDDEYAVAGHQWTTGDLGSVLTDRRLEADGTGG
ncbi:DNA polymerase ligase N-terminal domain-containing protein [Nocardioides halotolerans]|uniref:DNA polymerase ligase N-terminal domain-containing protein n=1 Tax=Nocardioides halotolerans TaxID=433660 RepID=UPI0003FEC3ED|nr:DNA polymerase ligase N-terminal domain-containing protein [Nocardioides halotolerans]